MTAVKASRLKKLLESSVPPIRGGLRDLEQYTTPAEIALAMAMHAKLAGMLDGAVVADLGAGTCRIAIAALLLGASKAVAVDVDERFYGDCLRASRALGLDGRLSYVVSHISGGEGPLRRGLLDLVMMNPPFGVWRRGADTEFLEYAMSLRPRAVIAIVKSGNIGYHEALARKHGYELRFLGTYEFPIPASMPRHRRRVLRIGVDLIELREQGGAG